MKESIDNFDETKKKIEIVEKKETLKLIFKSVEIKKVIADLIPNSIEFIPEVYIQDKNGARQF